MPRSERKEGGHKLVDKEIQEIEFPCEEKKKEDGRDVEEEEVGRRKRSRRWRRRRKRWRRTRIRKRRRRRPMSFGFVAEDGGTEIGGEKE